MIVTGYIPTFLIGCFGGFMGEALNWYLLRESPHIGHYRRGLRYWIATGVMIVVGGVLAILYGVEPKSALLVAQIGLTAPLLIKSLAQIPTIDTTSARELKSVPTIIDFVSGR